MRAKVVIAAIFITASICAGQTATRQDVWEPFKYFVGQWEGTGKGQPGVSKTRREYKFVLNNKFIQVLNRSEYEPQTKNPKGEIHDDWGFVSFDKARKQFVLRQFHVEGFVNEFVMTSSSADSKTIVFTSENLENIPAGYRARETYKIIGPDEFVEIFEIAGPGKDFEVYSENHYRRKK